MRFSDTSAASVICSYNEMLMTCLRKLSSAPQSGGVYARFTLVFTIDGARLTLAFFGKALVE